jgi:hypothetical protein
VANIGILYTHFEEEPEMSNTVQVFVSKLDDVYIISARDSYVRDFTVIAKEDYQENKTWIMQQVKGMANFDDLDDFRYSYEIETPDRYYDGGFDPEDVVSAN